MKNSKNTRIFIFISIAFLLLLVPFIAMQFSSEVNWNIGDFVIAGVLLFGTVLACEFVLRKLKKGKIALFVCVALLLILALVWSELAVGIFY